MDRPVSHVGLRPHLRGPDAAELSTGIRSLDPIPGIGFPNAQEESAGGHKVHTLDVRRLVELHGGTIVASSEGEGLGSCFTVRLSRAPSPETPAQVHLEAGRPAKSRRVLLIDDSGDAREMLRMMLELAGHVVYDAADGPGGLELLKAESPDVAMIDISLPRMDGYEVARRIRDQPHGRGMLLLAVTGYDSLSDSRRSAERGFDHDLVKPVDPDQLAALFNDRAVQEVSP